MTFVEEDDERLSGLSIKPFLKLFKYSLRRWPLLIAIVISLLFLSFNEAFLIPKLQAAAIDSMQTYITGSFPTIWDFVIKNCDFLFFKADLRFGIFMVVLIVSTLVRCATIFSLFYFSSMLELHIMNDLRRDAFINVQQLSFSYFDKTPTGWLIARMQNDTSSISEILGWSTVRLIWTAFELLFIFITMFTTHVFLSLIVLAFSPIIIVLAPIFQYQLLKRSRIARNAYSNYIRWLSECINGTATIKTLSIENKVYDECTEIVEDIKDKRYKVLKIHALFNPTINLVETLSIATILFMGLNIEAVQVGLLKDITPGILILFLNIISTTYMQFADLADLYSEFVSNQASAEKILLLIDEKPALVDTPEVIAKYGDLFNPKPENYEIMKGDIDLKNVCFEYKQDHEILHSINLQIKQGSSVAIVGETGSGKTTTANLLCRFYEPTKGQILIDGRDYKTYSASWIRSNIAYVQQNPFIFAGTIKENIRYGKLDATDEQIIEACKKVHIHDFIMSLDGGYDFYLKDGGNKLSQGQKQLISFARAIIRDPKILILDEATSSIDTQTEKQVQNAINVILKNRTAIIIAHRLSTIVDSDRILLMENGEIVEDGNHVTLMKKKQKYFNLYMSQFKELDIDSQLDVYAKEKQKIRSLKRA